MIRNRAFPLHILFLLAMLILVAFSIVYAQPPKADEAVDNAAVRKSVQQLIDSIKATAASDKTGQQVTSEGSVVNFAGDATIEAGRTVNGDVVAIGGNATVAGIVKGNVVAITGDVRLKDGASVTGDVIAIGGMVERAPKATVSGSKLQIAAPWAADMVKDLMPAAPNAVQPDETVAVPPASPALTENIKRIDSITQWGQPVTVNQNEYVTGDVASFGGPVTIHGKVEGDVSSFGGPITVEGTVHGDIASFGGPVTLKDGAIVDGDIATLGGPFHKDTGATHRGNHNTIGPSFIGFGHKAFHTTMVQRFVDWLGHAAVMAALCLLLILLLPQQMSSISDAIIKEPWQALAHGFISVLLIFPILFVLFVAVITWVAIPVVILVTIAAGVVGIVAMYLTAGRIVARRTEGAHASLLPPAFLGFAILTTLAFMRFIPIAGALISLFLALVFLAGFGATLGTGFGQHAHGHWFSRQHSGPAGAIHAARAACRTQDTTTSPEPEAAPTKSPTEPPAETTSPAQEVRHIDSITQWGNPVTVEANEYVEGDVTSYGGPISIHGEVAGDVSSLGGPVTVDGMVRGDISSYGGSVTIEGSVTGDIASYGGPVSLAESAIVDGDIATLGGPFTAAPGATYAGQSFTEQAPDAPTGEPDAAILDVEISDEDVRDVELSDTPEADASADEDNSEIPPDA